MDKGNYRAQMQAWQEQQHDREIVNLQKENERLRRALNRIGFYCAGTDFAHISAFVLNALSGKE